MTILAALDNYEAGIILTFMSSNFHFLTNSLLVVVCLVMGSSFLSIPIPKKEGLKSYRISLKVLSGAYFAMSLLTIAVLVFNLADNSREHFTFISIFISSSQALLFTFTLISLINPNFVKLKNVFIYLVPYTLFLSLYLISNSIYADPKIIVLKSVVENLNNPTIWIRILFLAYLIFQLIYYTFLFIREAKKYDEELLNYFSEVVKLKMKWVRIAFFSALAVGIISMVANFFPKQYDWIITLSFAIFYFGFAQEYIKYNKIFNLIEPAILVETTEPTPLQPPVRTKADWKFYKQQIITHRYYCEIGTNIEEMASKLNIGRTTLSTYINREEGVNFNTWINTLRIEDAKQILIDNPDYSIAIISEMVGYTEQANFSRQFKLITGESPLVWRKKSAAS